MCGPSPLTARLVPGLRTRIATYMLEPGKCQPLWDSRGKNCRLERTITASTTARLGGMMNLLSVGTINTMQKSRATQAQHDSTRTVRAHITRRQSKTKINIYIYAPGTPIVPIPGFPKKQARMIHYSYTKISRPKQEYIYIYI